MTQKLENVRSWLYVLSKTWANFMIWIISSFRNMSQNKISISKFLENQFNLCLRWITWYWITWQYGKEFDLLQLIFLDIMRILLTFSYFSTYSEIWWPPNFPLQRNTTIQQCYSVTGYLMTSQWLAVMLEAASQGYESSISDFIKLLGNCYRRSSRSREK